MRSHPRSSRPLVPTPPVLCLWPFVDAFPRFDLNLMADSAACALTLAPLALVLTPAPAYVVSVSLCPLWMRVPRLCSSAAMANSVACALAHAPLALALPVLCLRPFVDAFPRFRSILTADSLASALSRSRPRC